MELWSWYQHLAILNIISESVQLVTRSVDGVNANWLPEFISKLLQLTVDILAAGQVVVAQWFYKKYTECSFVQCPK